MSLRHVTRIGAHRSSLDLPLVFAAALTFYGLTLAPTVVWGDSAALSWRVSAEAFRFRTAGDHPVFLLTGWLFSNLPGEVARNVNLASAAFGALAVVLVYRAARLLGVSRVAAAAGAAALCVSHAFWLHSVIAEVYTANAFFLSAALNLLLEWRRRAHWAWLLAAVIAGAVGLMNHLVLGTALPAAAAFVVMTRGRALFSRAFSVVFAALATAVLVLVVARPPALAEAFSKIWYGPPGIAEYFVLDVAPVAMAIEVAYYFAFLAYQFPSVSFFLGFLGAVVLMRRDRAAGWLLLSTIAVNAFLFVHYTEWPSSSGTKYVFYIADYLVFAILCAVGTDRLLGWTEQHGGIARRRQVAVSVLLLVAFAPPLIYQAMPSLTRRAGINLAPARAIPYRDGARFFLNPNKRGDDGARRFAREVFDVLPRKAVIFADHTPYTVLRYVQTTERLRPDVWIAPLDRGLPRVRWVFEDGDRRPTYLATAPLPGYYDLGALTGEYDILPAGPIFEVRPGSADSRR